MDRLIRELKGGNLAEGATRIYVHGEKEFEEAEPPRRARHPAGSQGRGQPEADCGRLWTSRTICRTGLTTNSANPQSGAAGKRGRRSPQLESLGARDPGSRQAVACPRLAPHRSRAANIRILARAEGVDPFLAELAALLHDVGRTQPGPEA